MPPNPLVLAFDTSAAHCAVALLSGDKVLAEHAEEMHKGQAEKLFPLLEGILAQAGKDWGDLDGIGVGVGPGNFTGIRLSVSAARGLALALDIPAIGVSGFETIGTDAPYPFWAAIEARQDMCYVQYCDGSENVPTLTDQAELAIKKEPVLRMSDLTPQILTREIANIARSRLDRPQPRPKPLYVRSPDAAPSRDRTPVILP